jgi:hypothetical protein
MSEFHVTHEFDEYNNLTMIVTYYELVFRYTFSESYLRDWSHIRDVSDKPLVFDSGDLQSWQDGLKLEFPSKYNQEYIDALNRAIKDPRINTPVD